MNEREEAERLHSLSLMLKVLEVQAIKLHNASMADNLDCDIDCRFGAADAIDALATTYLQVYDRLRAGV